MEILKKYKCRVKLRETHNGHPLKPLVKNIDGKVLMFECMWKCEDDEKYPNEYAMGPLDFEETRKELHAVHITWLASGDLEIIEELKEERKQSLKLCKICGNELDFKYCWICKDFT